MGGEEAAFTDLPVGSRTGDWYSDPLDVCDGTGSWTRGTKGGRDGVVLRLDGTCGRETYLTIGGTEREPELFVAFGDPDAGDLRILKRP